MKCAIKGCNGHYERKKVDLVERHNGIPVVITDVPVLVCDTCYEQMIEPETMRQLDRMFENNPSPTQMTPLFKYNETASEKNF